MAVGRMPGVIHLVRSPTSQGGVRAVFIEPGEVLLGLAEHRYLAERGHYSPQKLALHRSDESLDEGDAAMLPNRSSPRADATTLAPPLEAIAPELGALVGDDEIRRGGARPDRPTQEAANLLRCRPLLPYNQAHDAAGDNILRNVDDPAGAGESSEVEKERITSFGLGRDESKQR